MEQRTINRLIIGAVSLASIGGVIWIVSKIKRDKELREFGDLQKLKDNDMANNQDIDVTGSEDVLPSAELDIRPNFNLKSWSQNIGNTMANGWSVWGYTDETELLRLLGDLSCDEMNILKPFFRSDWANYGWTYSNMSLREWVQADLSGSKLRKALGYIDCTS
jgi:hypothetical protein